jgi:CheY-like chemotaxis protein
MSHRIVIAEDETDIRANLTRLLTLEDYEVWAAPNGREALQLVRQHLPDIVLSDVMMPEMTGLQLVQALRADQLTAHSPQPTSPSCCPPPRLAAVICAQA